MKHLQRGFSLLAVVLVVGAVLIAAGVYFWMRNNYSFNENSNSQTATTSSDGTNNSNSNNSGSHSTPSATIDPDALAPSSPTPTISGSFYSNGGTPSVAITTQASTQAKPITNVVFSDTVAGHLVYSATTGKYETKVSTVLPKGTYYVGIYNRQAVSPVNGGAVQYKETLLVSKVFTINTTLPTVSIDQNALTTNSSLPVITGAFSGKSLQDIVIVVVPGTVTLPTMNNNPTSGSIAAYGPKEVSGTFPGSSFSSGRYSVSLTPTAPATTLKAGTYTIGIYSGGYLLLVKPLVIK